METGARRPVAALIADGSLFRAVVGSGMEPFVLSSGAADVLARSRFYAGGARVASPARDPDGFVTDLIDVGSRFEERPPLFFTHDGVLLLVSAHRDRLLPYFRLLMPPDRTVRALVHKSEFADLARSLDLPVPVSLRSDRIDDPREALAAVGLPCVLKPDSRHGGWHSVPQLQQLGEAVGKVLRADTPADFDRMYGIMRRVTDRFIVQTYVGGGDDRIFSYHAYLDERSRPLADFVGRKVRTWPRDSGVSTCLELVRDEEVRRLGAELAERIGLAGPVKFDFKRDRHSDRLYLLEVNARCTLWHHLGVVAGISLPLVAWCHLNGLAAAAPTEYRTGFRWVAPAADFRAFRKSYRPAVDLAWRSYLASLRGPLVFDLFQWDDPGPALARAWQRGRARVRGLLGARGQVASETEKSTCDMQ